MSALIPNTKEIWLKHMKSRVVGSFYIGYCRRDNSQVLKITNKNSLSMHIWLRMVAQFCGHFLYHVLPLFL